MKYPEADKLRTDLVDFANAVSSNESWRESLTDEKLKLIIKIKKQALNLHRNLNRFITLMVQEIILQKTLDDGTILKLNRGGGIFLLKDDSGEPGSLLGASVGGTKEAFDRIKTHSDFLKEKFI